MKQSAVLMLIVDDHVLMLKRAYRENQSNGWCLPGGKVDYGEAYTMAAAREAFEETGYKSKNTRHYIGDELSGNGEYSVNIFVEFPDEKFDAILEPNEHTEWAWVHRNNLTNLNLAGNTDKFIDKIFTSLTFELQYELKNKQSQ